MPSINILPTNCLNKAHPSIFPPVNKLCYTVCHTYVDKCTQFDLLNAQDGHMCTLRWVLLVPTNLSNFIDTFILAKY